MDLAEADAPIVLWDYAAEWRARIHNATSRNLPQMGDDTPYRATLGEEPDISNICVHKFYDFVYYFDQKQPFPQQGRRLGRFLGPCKDRSH